MKSTTVVRKAAEHCLSKFGYSLKIAGLPVRGFDGFLGFIKKNGFHPKTVFDVGVGY